MNSSPTEHTVSLRPSPLNKYFANTDSHVKTENQPAEGRGIQPQTVKLKTETEIKPIMATGMSNPGLVSLIHEFDGTNDFKRFQNTVLSTITMAGWSDKQAVDAIKLRLTGSALDFFNNNCSRLFSGENKKPITVLEELKKQFTTKQIPTLGLQELVRGTGQQPGEEVRVYAERVRELLVKAIPTDSTEDQIKILTECARASFLSGLHPSIQRFVVSSCPKDFEEAIENAVRESLNLSVCLPQQQNIQVAELSKKVEQLQVALTKNIVNG